jgi:hypothetical protein
MTSFIGPEGSSRAMRIPECQRRTPNRPPPDRRRIESTLSTFEEERREVLASVLHSLATVAPDPDHAAACCHLLRHLTRTPAYS